MNNAKNPMSDNLKMILKLNPNDLLITLNQKLLECSNAVFFGINSLELTTELPKSLRMEENQIFTHAPIGKLNIEQSRENFKIWILKKGFEDLISALTELLISFSSIIDLNEKIKLMKVTTPQKFVELICEPNDENSKKDFPKLIDKVNAYLKEPLKYNEEVKSINRVRRCLVHRNGVVRPLDFNIENGLELKWWFYEICLIENEKKKSIERFDIMTDDMKMEMTEIQKSKTYKENDRVSFDFQEFNELVHFCQKFGLDVLEKFKLNE